MKRLLPLLTLLALPGLSEPKPGLVASFPGDLRVQPRAALFAAPGAAPSSFAPAGAFAAELSGFLRLEKRSRLYFSFAGRGQVTLRVAGEIVLEDPGPELGQVESERIRLNGGDIPIQVSYRSSAEGPAILRSYWSGRDFARETIPATVLYHDSEHEGLATAETIRRRARLIARKQCLVCHGDAEPVAPAWVDIERWLAPTHVRAWATSPDDDCPQQLSEPEANHLASWLANSQPVAGQGTPPDPAGGADLVAKFHLQAWTNQLTGRRFASPGAVAAFLEHPDKLDPSFPTFDLSDEERRTLADHAWTSLPSRAARPDGDAAIGAKVFAANCATCHTPPQAAPATRPAWAALNWAQGCVAADRGTAPDLHLDETDRAALRAGGPVRKLLPQEEVGTLIDTIGCANCHNPDSLMPTLDWAGEKFQAAWLHKLFAGTLDYKPRGWLPTRMPAFPAHADRLVRGLAAQAGFDPEALEPAVEADAAVGKQLLFLEGGYGCINCHGVGDQAPIAVFEGQGPYLQHSRERLRYDYFMRWMQNPQRLAPASVMPRYVDEEGVATLGDVYEGDPHRQFKAVWGFLQTLAPVPGK